MSDFVDLTRSGDHHCPWLGNRCVVSSQIPGELHESQWFIGTQDIPSFHSFFVFDHCTIHLYCRHLYTHSLVFILTRI